MHSHRRHLTQHRFQRLILWTLTLLTWFAAILTNTRAVSTRHQHQRFDISLPWLTQLVGKLLIVRAAQLSRRRYPKRIRFWRHGRNLRPRHATRSILGARLRHALRHKDPRTWIANLIAVLRTLDTHAAKLVHRLRHGLTRMWPTRAPLSQIALVPRAPASPPALPNTS